MVDVPDSAMNQPLTEEPGDRGTSFGRQTRLLAFAALAIGWLGFIAFGQVRARFWIRNEFQIEWKSIAGIWRVALDELPGGNALEALVIASIIIFVLGVVGCLYLTLMSPDEAQYPAQDPS